MRRPASPGAFPTKKGRLLVQASLHHETRILVAHKSGIGVRVGSSAWNIQTERSLDRRTILLSQTGSYTISSAAGSVNSVSIFVSTANSMSVAFCMISAGFFPLLGVIYRSKFTQMGL